LSVTQALKGASLFYYPDTPAMQAAMKRGTLIHDATELLDKGTIDWSQVDDEIEPYLEQYEIAKHELKFKVKAWEIKVSHPALGYGGRIDKLALYQRANAIIDIKTGTKIREEGWHHLQVAGYRETYKRRPRAFILYLSQENYRWIEMDEKAPMVWTKLMKGVNAARTFCA